MSDCLPELPQFEDHSCRACGAPRRMHRQPGHEAGWFVCPKFEPVVYASVPVPRTGNKL